MDKFLEPENKPKFRFSLLKKPWVIVGLLALLVAISIGLSINNIMTGLLHSYAEVVVPKLEGKNLNEALGIVSQLKLSLRQDGTENDDTVPAGTIVRQHPPSGMKVREGRAINVVISMGGQAVYVPDVVGRPLPEVQSVLSQEKLQLGAVTEIYSSDVAEGLALTQDPSSSTVVTRGVMVDVTISKGPPPTGVPLMPNFIGSTVDNVQSWAEGVNAKVKISDDPKALGSPGQVVRQSPPPQQPVGEGETLKVTIVPRLLGQNAVRFSYLVPGEKEVTIRLMTRGQEGETEVYKGTHQGGETLEIPMTVKETTRVRIFIDDILQEERVVEP